MLRDFVTTARHVHGEYVRRHAGPTEPPEQQRSGLRLALGHGLIHLGERLARVEPRQPVDEAA